MLNLICLYQLEATSLIAAEAPDNESPTPLLKVATSLFHELKTTQTITSIYSHENTFIDNELRFNCYGFLLYLINSCHKEAFEDLLDHMDNLAQRGVPTSLDPGKPSPYNFFHIFKSLHNGSLESKYWQGVEDIPTIMPGDFLVYLEPDFVSPKRWNKDTCRVTHIMLVSKIIDKSPHLMKIEIIDSSHQSHSAQDTRHSLQPEGGLGKDFLAISKAETKGLYNLSWGTGMKNYMTKELFVGRLLTPSH